MPGEWNYSSLINSVVFSMTPSPCNAKCIYCNAFSESGAFTDEVRQGYEKIFEAIEYAKNSGLLSLNCSFVFVNGEISVHPYKDRFLDVIQGYAVQFSSNCFKFDQRIANHLRDNPNSVIDISIDSGTKETWHKIKGSDNFDVAVDNLANYYKNCNNGQKRFAR